MLSGATRWVIMVPAPELDRAATKDADVVLGSLLDFDPAAWGLPPYADD